MKCMNYLFLTLSFVLTMLSSCKKNKNLKPGETDDLQPAKPQRYVPVKFETATYHMHLNYQDNTTLLTSITDSNGDKILITYTKDQQLFKLEKYQKEKRFNVVYYGQPDEDRNSVAQVFDYDEILKTFTPAGSYHLLYNPENRISYINYYDERLNRTAILHYVYHGSGNLAEMNITGHPGSAETFQYTFDQKSGICQHISFLQLIALETDQWFFHCSLNNLLKSTAQKSTPKETSFSYEYHKNGYPSKMKVKDDEGIQVIEITYKQLSP